ncbi:cytochrome C oxidase subunit IV family protein [Ottowia testudinis]|uniref:Cytochrome C oxidase subunit IV family protein n=1 Tax=Ottowia testudinis TaxID=2816950 RepID=A0A975CLP5_9BURK|nr:cytochrome C oxidase subunit IV family protein [Ottowia testudinis]QTD45793.1 cytochrome C oxidase subunit IV family protein [Ottowia testudinis]
MKPRVVDLVWLLLLAATALTWGLSSSGWVARAGLGGMAVVFALAWLKGLGVILEFMELRHAPPLWRRALIGGLTLISALILLAYALALR